MKFRMLHEGHRVTIEDKSGSFDLRVEAKGRPPVAPPGSWEGAEGVSDDGGGGGEGKGSEGSVKVDRSRIDGNNFFKL